MAKKIYSVPQLQKVTTTENPEEFDLVMADEHSGGNSMNMSPLVLDFYIHLGSATINLPPLSSFFSGGGAGIGFMIHGTIVDNAPSRIVKFVAYDEDDETNTICDDADFTLAQVGTTFKIYISGRTSWGVVYCASGN